MLILTKIVCSLTNRVPGVALRDGTHRLSKPHAQQQNALASAVNLGSVLHFSGTIPSALSTYFS
jgi:hypothetical protein